MEYIKNHLQDISEKEVGVSSDSNIFNHFHNYIDKKNINHARLNIIKNINKIPDFRNHYYSLSKFLLETIVGNELSMQLRINMSIQMPYDETSILPIHSDTWAGDSPYEVVIWVPFVDCFKTKSMFILPQNKTENLDNFIKEKQDKTSVDLMKKIEKDIIYLDIPYGYVLVFNQSLPHGNTLNLEDETRFSMNCRFKSVFSPYGDKKLGEFFEPITLKAASMVGMNYKLPKIN